jgi:transposase
MRSMPGPLPPTVSRARARRFYEPSRFGRTVSTISIAAKIAVGIEIRSEGPDGATGGFGCPGMAPHRGRELVLGERPRSRARCRRPPYPTFGPALRAIPRAHARAGRWATTCRAAKDRCWGEREYGMVRPRPPTGSARARDPRRLRSTSPVLSPEISLGPQDVCTLSTTQLALRRVATRYDKLLANFMGFVKLAAIALWLKQLNRHHGPAVRSAPWTEFSQTSHPPLRGIWHGAD